MATTRDNYNEMKDVSLTDAHASSQQVQPQKTSRVPAVLAAVLILILIGVSALLGLQIKQIRDELTLQEEQWKSLKNFNGMSH